MCRQLIAIVNVSGAVLDASDRRAPNGGEVKEGQLLADAY